MPLTKKYFCSSLQIERRSGDDKIGHHFKMLAQQTRIYAQFISNYPKVLIDRQYSTVVLIVICGAVKEGDTYKYYPFITFNPLLLIARQDITVKYQEIDSKILSAKSIDGTIWQNYQGQIYKFIIYGQNTSNNFYDHFSGFVCVTPVVGFNFRPLTSIYIHFQETFKNCKKK